MLGTVIMNFSIAFQYVIILNHIMVFLINFNNLKLN